MAADPIVGPTLLINVFLLVGVLVHAGSRGRSLLGWGVATLLFGFLAVPVYLVLDAGDGAASETDPFGSDAGVSSSPSAGQTLSSGTRLDGDEVVAVKNAAAYIRNHPDATESQVADMIGDGSRSEADREHWWRTRIRPAVEETTDVTPPGED